MDEFQALIHSFGEHSVEYLRDTVNLSGLSVFGDEVNGAAHVEIVIEDLTWESHQIVIDHMITLREMFWDELSFDYVVLDENARPELESGHVRVADYAAA